MPRARKLSIARTTVKADDDDPGKIDCTEEVTFGGTSKGEYTDDKQAVAEPGAKRNARLKAVKDAGEVLADIECTDEDCPELRLTMKIGKVYALKCPKDASGQVECSCKVKWTATVDCVAATKKS